MESKRVTAPTLFQWSAEIAPLSLCLFSLALWLLRCKLGGSSLHFMVWNLLLAFIPFALSFSLRFVKSTSLFWLGLACWLLWFPNAHYLLTDLVHLRVRDPIPWWFDVMFFFSFAMSGCFLGWFSLLHIRVLLSQRLPAKVLPFSLLFIILLASFGISLGRFQRFNSWDILQFQSLMSRAIDTLHSPRTIGFTLLMAIFIGLGFQTFITAPASRASSSQ
jgi:uncharacterized membrane protein